MHGKGSSSFVCDRPEMERLAALAWMAEHEEIFGRQRTEVEVREELCKDPELYQKFDRWNELWKKEFIAFCMGVQGMSLTYDPIFKKICSPEEHPERLKEFLSLCLGQDLEIVEVLPNESSDPVMRQYVRVRNQKKAEGKRFSYKDIKKVYTIVLIQKSTSEFHAFPDQYLHYSKQMFNTGLELNMIQEYILIPLDIFRQNNQNISNRLDGWLQLLSSDSPEDIRRLLEVYPDFAEVYREVFQFRYQMKELISMFSEALSILDANTVQYMVESQQEEIKKQKEEIEQKDAEIEQWKAQAQQESEKIERLKENNQRRAREIEQLSEKLQAALEENARLKALQD